MDPYAFPLWASFRPVGARPTSKARPTYRRFAFRLEPILRGEDRLYRLVRRGIPLAEGMDPGQIVASFTFPPPPDSAPPTGEGLPWSVLASLWETPPWEALYVQRHGGTYLSLERSILRE